MFLNVSGKSQSLSDRFLERRVIHPREVVSEWVYPDITLLPKQFKKINKIDFKGVKSILFKRSHALGDVVMTFPLVNYFESIGVTATIHTNTRYTIPGVKFVIGQPRINPADYDLVVDLNWVLEIDHYNKKYFTVNRVDIYKEYLNLKNIGNDWGADFLKVNTDIKDAVIAIQLKGSTVAKVIDTSPLLDELEKRNIKFYVIDALGEYKGKYKNAVVKPTDLVGLLNIFLKVKGVLTFDSGPLWLSHITNTPAFVVVGPTSGEKITSRHPNTNTTYYDTKTDYNCEYSPYGCGEGALECNGNFSCLKNVNYDKLKDSFFKWVERIV